MKKLFAAKEPKGERELHHSETRANLVQQCRVINSHKERFIIPKNTAFKLEALVKFIEKEIGGFYYFLMRTEVRRRNKQIK